MAVGSAKAVPNGQDVIGGHYYGAVDYSGPVAYTSGGDTIDPHIFGFPNTILTLIGSDDQPGTYQVVPKPLYNGTTVWRLVWQTPAGVEATGNLSAYTVRLSAIGY